MTPRPRLLIAVTLGVAGGAQTFAATLARGLCERWRVDVASGDASGPLADACAALEVGYHHVPSLVRDPDPRSDLRAIADLRLLARSLAVDVVQLNSSKAGLIGRLAMVGGPATVFTAHGWAFAQQPGAKARQAYLAMERATAPLADAIVCVAASERERALAAGIRPAARLHVIHNGIDAPASPPERGPWPLRPRLVTVARLNADKDVATLLAALAQPAAQAWRAEIVGDGPEREALEAQCDALDLRSRVRFAGERDDVADRLAQADAFVLPSRMEALPMSILEAMAAALPVVACDVGGVAEEVADGRTGLLVPPEAPGRSGRRAGPAARLGGRRAGHGARRPRARPRTVLGRAHGRPLRRAHARAA